jgi:hypothetical protein
MKREGGKRNAAQSLYLILRTKTAIVKHNANQSLFFSHRPVPTGPAAGTVLAKELQKLPSLDLRQQSREQDSTC